MEDNGRFVDQLLDSALAQYRDAEPRTGLEGRILSHVRGTASERSAASKAWRLWAAAAAAAAVLALVAIYTANRALRTVPQASQAANTVPVAPPTEALKANSEPAAAAASVTKVVEPKHVAHRGRKPLRHVEEHHWPSQFPTPAPLTAEQKALVQYVRDTPPRALAASLSTGWSLDQPVEIKPLKIPPLKIQPVNEGSRGEELQ